MRAVQRTIAGILYDEPVVQISQSTGDGDIDINLAKVRGVATSVDADGNLMIGLPVAKLHCSNSGAISQGGNYTSTAEDASRYCRITGWVFCDRAGSLEIQQCATVNGTYRAILTEATVASTLKTFNVNLVLPFVRIKWTEGGAGATTAHEITAYLRAL
ncbi:MAG: hypothetical protein WC683_07575 [bacterium]